MSPVAWLPASPIAKSLVELKISQNTVKNYLFRIFNKLGVSSRIEVVLYAASQRRADRSPFNGFDLVPETPHGPTLPRLSPQNSVKSGLHPQRVEAVQRRASRR